MRLLILAAAAFAAPSVSAANEIKLEKEHCKAGPTIAGGAGKAASRRLGELPPGQLILTVYREENGCPKPLVVRRGIGFEPRR